MLGHMEAIATVDTVGIVGAGIVGSLRWSGAVQTGTHTAAAVGLRRYRYLMLVVQVLLLAGVNVVGLGIYRYRVMNILLDHGDLVVVMCQWYRMGR